MREDLNKKVERAVKLIKAAGAGGDVVEVCYSGGKDSDVILELAKMSGIKYRAIYKNTTIDPPHTLKHVREKGVEVVQPQKAFFELVALHGFPSRHRRFCCRYMKEYKILDKAIIGVRRAERIAAFSKYPRMVRAYTKAGQRFYDTHPKSAVLVKYKDVFEQFTREVFFDSQAQFEEWRECTLFDYDYKAFLENYFNVKL